MLPATSFSFLTFFRGRSASRVTGGRFGGALTASTMGFFKTSVATGSKVTFGGSTLGKGAFFGDLAATICCGVAKPSGSAGVMARGAFLLVIFVIAGLRI